VQVTPIDGAGPDEVLRYAATAERVSEHPLGRAIVRAAEVRGLTLPQAMGIQVLTGLGVQARLDHTEIVVGSQALLDSRGITLSDGQERQLADLERQGHTVIPVALDQRVIGLISLADALRPNAPATLHGLKAEGVQATVMISGDNLATVEAVARQLGVDEYHGQMLPAEKLALIQGMKDRGQSVAYVGDGVNDAPALAAADIGIAMGVAGTDLAIETADVALMRDDMERLPYLIALSKETLSTIRVSVLFSMSVNLLSVVLGILGIIGPAFGAVMHELSALPVLAYSVRLVSYRYRRQDQA
jgi:P-type E1-E2 ATPase